MANIAEIKSNQIHYNVFSIHVSRKPLPTRTSRHKLWKERLILKE